MTRFFIFVFSIIKYFFVLGKYSSYVFLFNKSLIVFSSIGHVLMLPVSSAPPFLLCLQSDIQLGYFPSETQDYIVLVIAHLVAMNQWVN